MNTIQRWLAFGILFISSVSTPRILLATLPPLPGVPLEFYTLTLSLADFLLIALLVITGSRLCLSRAYRAQLWATFQALWRPGWIPLWLAVVVWMGLSALWALEPTLTRFATLQAGTGVLAMILVADLVRAEGATGLLKVLAGTGVIQSLIALAQVATQVALGNTGPGFFRPAALTHTANHLGGVLLLAIFASLALFARDSGDHARWCWLLAAVVSAVGLVFTLSRGTFLAIAVAALPLLIVALRHASPHRRWQIIGAVVALSVASLSVAFVAARGDLAGRLFGSRQFFFEDAWRVIQISPLLGSGAGNLMYTISWRLGVVGGLVFPVHIVYVYVWAEIGLVGLIGFLLACGSAFRGWRPIRASLPLHTDRLLWGSALIGLLVTMLFENFWWAVRPFQVLFFCAFGLWYGLHRPVEASMATSKAPSDQKLNSY